MKTKTSQRRRSLALRPEAEPLEGRVVMSWTTPPSSVNLKAKGNDRLTITSFGSDGVFNTSSSITRREVDYRTFVANRTGTYTFEARANGSKLDTVAALYSSTGRRIAFNDNASSNSDNSRFTAQLNAGQTYVFGVSNRTNKPQGRYGVTITPPSLSVSAKANGGNDGFSEGSASLQGANLRLTLYGFTPRPFNITDHYIQVRILDINGQAIHTNYYEREFRTAGNLVPGAPREKSDTWDINVSNLDMSRASNLWIRVGYY